MINCQNFVIFVCSLENTCKAVVSDNEKGTSVPSYPRKRVSRLIRRRPNLDSRVRGNDESSGWHMAKIPSIFIVCRRVQAHGHFVVNTVVTSSLVRLPSYGCTLSKNQSVGSSRPMPLAMASL